MNGRGATSGPCKVSFPSRTSRITPRHAAHWHLGIRRQLDCRVSPPKPAWIASHCTHTTMLLFVLFLSQTPAATVWRQGLLHHWSSETPARLNFLLIRPAGS
jgi:hypothetical protein